MFRNNLIGQTILGKDFSLPLHERGERLNNNVLLLGSPGAGKSRCYIKPNLLEMNSSYVVLDTKGELTAEFAPFFAANGYDVRIFNAVHPEEGMSYNPLFYARNELEIRTLAETLYFVSAKSSTDSGFYGYTDDVFWQNAAILLLEALLLYLHEEYYLPCKDNQDKLERGDYNLAALSALLSSANVKENDDNYRSPLDLLFEEIETGYSCHVVDGKFERKKVREENPNSACVKKYKAFRVAADKTLKSILISLNAPLSVLLNAETLNATRTDDFSLETLGDRKTVLFIICSDTTPARNALSGIMLKQLFCQLTTRADSNGGILPTHVRFILDDFPTVGRIPGFGSIIATCRSRNMSAFVVAQSIGQLQDVYSRECRSIMECCDSWVYISGQSIETLSMFSELAGLSIRDFTKSLKPGYCSIVLKGENVKFSEIYPLESHPNYSRLSSSGDTAVSEIVQNYKSIKAALAAMNLAYLEYEFEPLEKIASFIETTELNLTPEGEINRDADTAENF